MCLEDYPRCVKLCNKVDLTDSFPLARARAEGIATVMTSARPLRLRGGESDYYATDCAHTNFGIGSDEDGVRGGLHEQLPRRAARRSTATTSACPALCRGRGRGATYYVAGGSCACTNFGIRSDEVGDRATELCGQYCFDTAQDVANSESPSEVATIAGHGS